MELPIIELRNVKKYFWKRRMVHHEEDAVKAVDDVSLSCAEGETFGLVGESGSGKSTVAKIIAGILEADEGDVIVRGESDIVFQDPHSSLNPRMTVKQIVGEALYVRGEKKDVLEEKVKRSLSMVKLNWEDSKNKFPHQFSGGERQRIAVARSLVREPSVLILDEPVSSLDVSIQAGVLNLLKDLQKELKLTYLFISHDLRVVEFMSDNVGVMKEGRLVEVSSREELYSSPKDPYTKHLLESIPEI